MHVGGTMLAAGLALERGWAINVGGGMHHACADRGMGWCPFDDIVLAVRRVRRAAAAAAEAAAAAPAAEAAAAAAAPSAAWPEEEEEGAAAAGVDGAACGAAAPGCAVLVIDLDAHQGNGVARDKLDLPVEDLYILDAYNERVFPRDDQAAAGIDIAMRLRPGAGDEEYLGRLEGALHHAATVLPRPALVVFNAGTDVLAGDPLGRLGLSGAGVVARDEMVWRWCRDVARAPVVMLLSGGYTAESAGVISASIANLFDKFGLGGKGAGKA
ncbi:hypothetical protein GPECTOR_12g407 [Gonium pectorale]|uniref:Histone deacetylase domain-containing protein n=1 Tax=Gonium pectorale TaxID=33097 RepID=A0A150GNR2_GONPE|nr:hypothetical protein GPECTOR_12g407 [Gonium pectorale]|eukprot:KXZ51444.1 hypothetical protein GPECTOR_12g407 [Gonium pectorale]